MLTLLQIEHIKWKEFANYIKQWHKNACHKYELSLRWTMIVHLDNFYIKIYVQKKQAIHAYIATALFLVKRNMNFLI